MSEFLNILAQIRKESFNQRDKGTRFERLIKAYLKTDPMYAQRLEVVWLWNEFPYRNTWQGKDVGIDLVALDSEGCYWAIQCKCYDENTQIDKPAIDSFLATAGGCFKDKDNNNQHFSQRLWVDTTTKKWSSNAENVLSTYGSNFTRLSFWELEKANVNWEQLSQNTFGSKARGQIKQPRPHQQEAIANVCEHFKTTDRGKLIMACGTGKTFTSLKIAEQQTQGKGLVLFLVPSISLLNQTLREWSDNVLNSLNAICVCSDSRVSQTRKTDEDDSDEKIIDLALPASTNTKQIAGQISHSLLKGEQCLTVVFSTYQSIDVVSKAQQILLEQTEGAKGVFDLIICDEAHRTTGTVLKNKQESHFTKVHDNDFLQAKKRLYMTATPRLYNDDMKERAKANDVFLCSMDDEALYGKEVYRLGFGSAVEKGLLTDYKVIVLTIKEGEKKSPKSVSIESNGESKECEVKADDVTKMKGCISALSKIMVGDNEVIRDIDPAPMKRAVAFCQNINLSKITSEELKNSDLRQEVIKEVKPEEKENVVSISSQHIDGTMSAPEKEEKLQWLKQEDKNPNKNQCKILCNVRCLCEGVDVPSLDAVIFVSPKNSQVDVVQSVGRVMRKAEGKKYGYIIIPVVIPNDAEDNKVLENHQGFKVVWTVLNALRAHDDRFNAEINKIEFNKGAKPTKHTQIFVTTPYTNDNSNTSSQNDDATAKAKDIIQRSLSFNDVQGVIYAKMVEKVGNRRYWDQWAKDIADIAQNHIQRINNLIAQDTKHKEVFERLVKGLRKNINPNLSANDIIEMLSQHIITQPVLEALFNNTTFKENNPMAKSMQKMLDLLDDEKKDEQENKKLQDFYKYVQDTVGKIDSSMGRQQLIKEIYEKFFQVAAKKTVDKLGIVYTPIEVVDFIIHSVSYVLQQQFHRSFDEEDVQIIDPFTGTGTFITRLLESGEISPDVLQRKYEKEIHANEIVLMAYYIASINIESTFLGLDKTQEYTPFKGICLTDTFQLGERASEDNLLSDEFPVNSQRAKKQKSQKITVVISNPPYSVGQKNSNDNNQNESYPYLEQRIADTYVKYGAKSNKSSLYDSYIKAFRWASDRIDDKQGGIIGFITNGSYIDSNSADGLRKSFEKEFSSIYVFNLRGAIRGRSKDLAKQEGQNVFNIMTGVAITILVKKPKANKDDKAQIYYYDIGNYLSREEKLKKIAKFGSVKNVPFSLITPNEHGDWVNKRNALFSAFTVMGDKKDKSKKKETFFCDLYSCGIKTQRDEWVYNSSLQKVKEKAKEQIDFYNAQRELLSKKEIKHVDFKQTHISWTRAVLHDIKKNKEYKIEDCEYREAMYRPFFKQHLLYYAPLNEMQYQIPKLFPNKDSENLLICTPSIGDTKDFSCLITNVIPDLHIIGASQCFPLYYYRKKEKDLFSSAEGDEYERREAITDFILQKALSIYGTESKISKTDIFYYVYGLLHSQEYRKEFSNDLKKMLPHIPFVDTLEDFEALSSAGRQLAELHLNYENIEPYKANVQYGTANNVNYCVDKMKLNPEKTLLFYNSQITIELPEGVFGYVVNGKSALEWLIERYQYTTNKNSNILNNPNDWSVQHKDEKYIFNLVLRIINVSLQTQRIVNSLPHIDFQ